MPRSVLRPRGRWLVKEPTFRAALDEYDGETAESLAGSCAKGAEILRSKDCYLALNREVIEALATAVTETAANQAVQQVYDFADDARIWMGFPG